jgi:hypothetical protein
MRLFGWLLVGCAIMGCGEGGSSDDEADVAGRAHSHEAVVHAIDDAMTDKLVSFHEADAIITAVLGKSGANDERLETARDFFFATLPKSIDDSGFSAEAGAAGDAADALVGGQALVEALALEMPRNLHRDAASKQGLSVTTALSARQAPALRHPDAFAVEITGTSQVEYKLTFTLAETTVSATIPKDATPEATAQLVAQAITASADAVLAGQVDDKGKPNGILSKFDRRILAAIDATADGAKVILSGTLKATE